MLRQSLVLVGNSYKKSFWSYLQEFFGFLVVLACPPFLKVAELEDFDLQLNAELFDRHDVNKSLHLQGSHFESPNQQMENLKDKENQSNYINIINEICLFFWSKSVNFHRTHKEIKAKLMELIIFTLFQSVFS